MQYAFTRAVAGHMFQNYDGVLKVDGELGSKKAYDPRSYLALAEVAMAERVKRAVSDLRGNGKTMFAACRRRFPNTKRKSSPPSARRLNHRKRSYASSARE
jgi:hypothetical protein